MHTRNSWDCLFVTFVTFVTFPSNFLGAPSDFVGPFPLPPPVILMQMLDSSHLEPHFGGYVNFPS